MQSIKRSPITRFIVVPLTLVALLSGCHHWSTPSQSPVDFIRDEEPSKVRLTLTDGRVVVLDHPTVADSTISASDGDLLRVVPLDDVVRLEQRRFDTPATFGLIVLFAGLTAAVGASMPGSFAGS